MLRQKEYQRANGYNIGWMVPFNTAAFSLLAAVSFRYGLVVLAPLSLMYFVVLFHVGRRIDAMQEPVKTIKTKKIAKQRRVVAKKQKFSFIPVFSLN